VEQGIPLPFTEAMNPGSASVGPVAQSVFLEVVRGTTVTELQPLQAHWSNGDTLLTLAYTPSATTGTHVGLASFGHSPQAAGAAPAVLRIRLLGGPKGPSTSSGPALQGADGMRLDGSPPQGGPPGQVSGQSGDGNQGGDFQWDITVTFPVVDGPHVNWKASKVPAQMSFGNAAKIFGPNGAGINLLFDAPMDTSLPPSGQVNTNIITLQVKTTQVPVSAKWTNATTLNLQGVQPQMELAVRTLVQSGGPIAFTLAGGPKGTAPPGTSALQSADGRRLDGAPPAGSGQLATNGLSGDGAQGGDYVQTINVSGG
ncbi:MAG: hypothetical protein ABR591_15755, partial [Candidatus Velthaea sp.]